MSFPEKNFPTSTEIILPVNACESLAFNQISRMSYAIRVTKLTQVLLVISQWSNVIGQAIWLNKTLDFADVLCCNVKRT